MNWGRTPSLTNPNPDSREQQTAKGFGGAGHHRHPAPNQNRKGYDIFTYAHISPARNRDSRNGVKQGKGNAA